MKHPREVSKVHTFLTTTATQEREESLVLKLELLSAFRIAS